MPRTISAATAYSYIRFSSPQQGKGDSRRRQQELRDAWLTRTGAVLDTSLTLHDEGVSAFSGGHRQNPDRHALAEFLELVRRGRVPRGSFLVIENLDRLSREHIQPALLLVLGLLQAGVRIVQLSPSEVVFDDKSDAMPVMMMVMELSRGHSESMNKSNRVGAAWKQKKAAAAADKTPLTKRVPAWLVVNADGKIVTDPDKAAVVRTVYRLAADGYGLGSITKRLNAEKVAPIGRAAYWARSYVAKLLGTRATTGEYQPHTRRNGKRRAEGKPIPGYYPVVVTDDQWHAARAALTSRRTAGGRPAKDKGQVNLFHGLLRDARDGGRLHVVNKGPRGGGPTLASYLASQGVAGAKYVGFQLEVFQRAILSRLREIDPREILPGSDGAADKVLTFAGRVATLEDRIAKLKASLIGDGEIDPLIDALRALEDKRSAAAADLAAANREAASPLSTSWGKCATLIDALDSAPDPADARVRLRAALRRIVQGVWCVFVARPPLRIAACQVWFTGDGCRDYLILHRGGMGNKASNRPAETMVYSLADKTEVGPLDFRKKRDAAKLAKLLEEFEIPTG